MENTLWYVVAVEKSIDGEWQRTFKTRREEDWQLWLWPDGTFWDIYRPDDEEKTVGKLSDYVLCEAPDGTYLTSDNTRWLLSAP